MSTTGDGSLTFDLNGIRVAKPRAPKSQTDQGLAVCPFKIVVSNNETIHGMDYEFTGMVGDRGVPLVVPVVSRYLKTGDYTLEGFENRCCVERKQLSDLFMCCGPDRDRFRAEVERMSAMEFSVVMIEADWREILDPYQYRPGWQSEMNPRSVEGTIISWSMRHKNVHWWACGDRRGAECRTFSILRKFWDEQQG